MRYTFNFLVIIMFAVTVTSCSTGYYTHLPRAKKKTHAVEHKEHKVVTVNVMTEDVLVSAPLELSAPIKIATVIEKQTPQDNTEVIIGDNKIAKKAVVKKQFKKLTKPLKIKRNGYPDSSLWFFYTGVFLMLLGLIFILMESLGFGVGLPFIIIGAFVMMLGLFVS